MVLNTECELFDRIANCNYNNEIYIHPSMEVIEPDTPIKLEPREKHIKILIVPDRGNQILIVLNIPDNSNPLVKDFLDLFKLESQLLDVTGVYLVEDIVHDVRYVVTTHQKSMSGGGEVRKSLNGMAPRAKRFHSARSSLASSLTTCSCPRKNHDTVEERFIEDKQDNCTHLTSHLRANSQILLTYPASPHKGRITVSVQDFMCLQKDNLINDIIIDFYLMYLAIEILPPEDQMRVYVFNTYFFTRLTSVSWSCMNSHNMTLAATQHAAVKTWTRTVDIFKKDFIIIPINRSEHWFLVVVCYPSMISSDVKKTDSNFRDESCRPCIIIFDSMPYLRIRKTVVVQELKDYLKCEYAEKMGSDASRSISDMPVIYADVPRQNNSFDCGLYTLQFAENFLKDFVIPKISFTKSLKDWFTADMIQEKRQDLKKLLMQLTIQSRTSQNFVDRCLNGSDDLTIL
ncbi:hypothetical protein QAD02_023359 [Eretmocerus hayati]|uniref:Uncharacterized protein n=1 Tax=Eretmocerus hayati TaxID=131215 RepID=A0ACC2PVE9_9HYME|nr:hypothetical protein QAD02_023359 [Eretmocerus hayati]